MAISKIAVNFFGLAQACASLYELGQADKPRKHHKCQSNLFSRQKLILDISSEVKKVRKSCKNV